ncbi:hypothetical protein BC833DRAFT_384194 [Globomyces pollinis-pini]|nr:hypothetical protein BC833DRAFT_384194 [Globomyces pollinis-pini]
MVLFLDLLIQNHRYTVVLNSAMIKCSISWFGTRSDSLFNGQSLRFDTQQRPESKLLFSNWNTTSSPKADTRPIQSANLQINSRSVLIENIEFSIVFRNPLNKLDIKGMEYLQTLQRINSWICYHHFHYFYMTTIFKSFVDPISQYSSNCLVPKMIPLQ